MSLPYSEGDGFSVPLGDDAFAVGVVARMDAGGLLIGYFFGPRRHGHPKPAVLAELRPDQADLVVECGDLGLIEGTWKRLGRVPGWDRDKWPVPVFGQYIEIHDVALRIKYDEELGTVRQERVSRAEIEDLPRYGVYGEGAVEKVLAHRLS